MVVIRRPRRQRCSSGSSIRSQISRAGWTICAPRFCARNCAIWTRNYRVLEEGLRDTPGLIVIERPEEESYVGSSIQFLLLDWQDRALCDVIDRCAARGVELKWFGAPEPVAFTSRYDSWRYAPSEAMPATDRVLAGIVDMRVPLTFSTEDCALIARIIRSEVTRAHNAA